MENLVTEKGSFIYQATNPMQILDSKQEMVEKRSIFNVYKEVNDPSFYGGVKLLVTVVRESFDCFYISKKLLNKLTILLLFVIPVMGEAQTTVDFDGTSITYTHSSDLSDLDTKKWDEAMWKQLKRVVATIPSRKNYTMDFHMSFLDKPDRIEILYKGIKEGYELSINGSIKKKSTVVSAIRAYLLADWYFMITGKQALK